MGLQNITPDTYRFWRRLSILPRWSYGPSCEEPAQPRQAQETGLVPQNAALGCKQSVVRLQRYQLKANVGPCAAGYPASRDTITLFPTYFVGI